MQSADIPAGPHNPNGYSKDEVLHELRGLRGTRRVSFRYEHLDRDLNRIKDLDNVISGSVDMQYTSSIKRTATFTIRGDNGIDFIHDHIKPWYRLHMPPKWTEERYDPEWNWDNSFASSVTGAADYDMIDATGDPVEDLSGQVFFTSDREYRTSNTLQFGETSTGTGGYIVTPTMDLDGDLRRFRGYMYFDEGVNHQNVWRDEQGGSYGGWDSDNTQSGFAVNGRWAQVFLSGVDVGSEMVDGDTFYNQLKDRWVRVEIDFDYGSKETTYKFFWNDPHRGVEPDYEHVTSFSTDQRVHGFEIDKLDDDGTFPNAAMYWSRVSLGDVNLVPSQPNPSDNDYVEWPLGVFLLSTPVQTAKDDVVTREIEAFDRAQLFLDDKLGEQMVIEKGEVYTDVMKNLIDSRFPDLNVPYIIEPSTYVCGRTRQFEVGTEIKEILDRIAESINYHTMQVDENGTVVYRPYVSPGDRTPEFDYSDDEISIMYDDVEAEFDIYDIANVWIVSLSETEEDPVYVKLENRDPANPFSIERRGRRIVDFREQEEGVDPSTIMTKAKRIQFEANRQYENIDFETLTNPLHSVNDCYTINYSDLNIKNKYTETGWEMSLEAGATMTHSARRNVNLDPELFDGFVDEQLTVNGSLTAGNIAWGMATVPITKTNVPQSVAVTGLDLQGTGYVEVYVTAVSSVPQNVKGVCSQDESPTGFTIWLYRATLQDTDVHWLALRKV